jgi:hypothetical protein
MKILAVAILICAGAICGVAQPKTPPPKPDLSGVWAFDPSRSNVGKNSAYNVEITITHHDPELKMLRKLTLNGKTEQKELTYFTDGRGETNPTTVWLATSPDGKSPHAKDTESRTIWSRDRIVIRSHFSTTVGIHRSEEDLVDEWKLSADGKTLTQTSSFIFPPNTVDHIVVPARREDDKRVYKLISK